MKKQGRPQKRNHPRCPTCEGTGYADKPEWFGNVLDLCCLTCHGRGVLVPFVPPVQPAQMRRHV